MYTSLIVVCWVHYCSLIITTIIIVIQETYVRLKLSAVSHVFSHYCNSNLFIIIIINNDDDDDDRI